MRPGLLMRPGYTWARLYMDQAIPGHIPTLLYHPGYTVLPTLHAVHLPTTAPAGPDRALPAPSVTDVLLTVELPWVTF